MNNSPWKNGKGDVVKELTEACREEGLKFAVYLSPWDRNHPEYGRPAYVEYFRNQLRELLTNYGEIFEVWFDGANGGDGWYGGSNETRKIDVKKYYNWPETYKMIRQLQPQCLIWNDGSDRGDLSWVGTEAGNVGTTNWSQLNKDGDVNWNMLHFGLKDGDSWVPGETRINNQILYCPEEESALKVQRPYIRLVVARQSSSKLDIAFALHNLFIHLDYQKKRWLCLRSLLPVGQWVQGQVSRATLAYP